LILRKITKFVANRCKILTLKCTKFDKSAGAPSQTSLEELAVFRRPASKGRGRARGGEVKGNEGQERGKER